MSVEGFVCHVRNRITMLQYKYSLLAIPVILTGNRIKDVHEGKGGWGRSGR
jgi:hypothetical protein